MENGNALDTPTFPYVLLAMFPYYNHLFGTTLRRVGLTVRWEDTLKDAWERMHHAQPRVVVCWIGRCPPDGLVLLKQMKASALADIPVVAIVEQGGDPNAYITMGAAVALVIPFEPVAFVECVKRLLPPTN